jgi:hypothetical protein
MTKQVKLYQAALLTLAVISVLVGTEFKAAAQDKAKVGDRVENVQMYGEKGTIQEVGTGEYKDCYLVLADVDKGKGKKGNWVCTYGQQNILFLIDASDKRVRDINAYAAKPAQQEGTTGGAATEKPKADNVNPNNPAGEKPAQCGGELLLKPKTKGRAASAALFKEVIKSLWDKENDPGKDNGRRVTTVTSLTVGASYRWRPNIDFQSLGTKPKTVYPVKVKYTMCTEGLLGWTVQESTSEELYSCFIGEEFGDWQCAIKTAGTFKRRLINKP